VAADVLTSRALNRATMARQLLLERADIDALAAIEHLVGLQAQEPHDPYLALWSRLEGFDPDELSQLLLQRRAVRIPAMRSTVHLLSADDCLRLRPLVQPVLDGELARHPMYGAGLRGVDLAPVLDAARELLDGHPQTMAQLRQHLGPRFPDLDAGALAYACRNHLALVQVPPRGVWGQRRQVTVTTAESWLGRPLEPAPSIDEMVLRYLAAFGPALPADVAAWSRLTGFREILDRLRPRLRTFRDERGRELFDVPDAPLPDPAVPAPPRFLPEYDNAVLSHSDRSRYTPEGLGRIATGERVLGSVLDDGMLWATWSLQRAADTVTMVIRHLGGSKRRIAVVAAEAERALAFLEPAAMVRDIRFEPAISD
jgi:hypothetical protein